MEFVFHPDALTEFKAEIAYYEGKQAGLGVAFAEETLRIIELVCLFPRIGSPEEAGVRSVITKRFPFLIYYEVLENKLWIWAVMHAAREPGYWRSRRQP
jgi:toxin ParE1/3/4